ncbi:S-adenosyl-L-methionine-dependent methyltransferase [Pleurotus eryngii]|uniref:S-adenosyl-L-methionine-dependent methyltransferase n=1 Tax=Pleurotus eryngii TaxID=5323 RepID=A0A9P5ZSS4_PLEER|nr:S-adenosyl-L-methionine-dependent methyltransferase [Pleurotus eryngii]
MGTPTSNLRLLANIILENVDTIDKLAKEQGVPYPTIDTLYNGGSQSEKFTIQPKVLNASLLATSAASQLIATLKLPGLVLLDRANAFHVSSALRIVVETGVVEILREAGPKGLHVADIASKVGVDSTILGRSIRMLATHYVFRELEPNVFANNRVSSLIDSGKASAGILGSLRKQREGGTKGHGVTNVQGDKYTGTNGISALVEQCTDEVFKSSAHLPDIVLSNDYSKSAFQTALQFDGSMWEFFEKNPGYLQRIQMAMVAWTNLRPHQANLKGFEWEQLQPNSVVVDIGGGNGSEGFEIAKRAPKIKVVVQDREQTIQSVTTPTWNAEPDKKKMLESGQVKLEGQDFFEKQPSHLDKQVSVFFLRLIMHDWPTKEGVKILQKLHEAAAPTTKLVIVDQVVPYACPNPKALAQIEGATLIKATSPLLANLGEASSDVYTTDFTMAALLNSQERTLGEFKEMVEEAGWAIEKVYQTAGSSFSQIVCALKQ